MHLRNGSQLAGVQIEVSQGFQAGQLERELGLGLDVQGVLSIAVAQEEIALNIQCGQRCKLS